ncbi:hypothetical protein PCLA_07f0212 [Pseudomonas citronellolis]|nr:hypothetical protein PCLA_07f0212 [Pseudomonas citronellolis]
MSGCGAVLPCPIGSPRRLGSNRCRGSDPAKRSRRAANLW